MADFTPYLRGHSRVFLIEGGPRPDHVPLYMGCMMAGGVTQDFGATENVECPSPDQHNQWEVVTEIKAATGRASTTLTGRYALDIESTLLRMAKKRCRVDVVIIGGDCTDPSSYNVFQKAKHLEGGSIENHATEDEGSLSSGDNASVNESADLTAREQYEVMPMGFARQADTLVTTEVIDVTICDDPSCGDCTTESDGCQKIYAVMLAASGSPTMAAQVVYSIDGGVTWNTSYVDSLLGGEVPTGIACVNGYVVVTSTGPVGSESIHYVLQSELDATGDETWTEIATGVVAGRGPNDIWSTGRYAYVAGLLGYVYGTDDATAGLTVLNAAAATDPTTGVAITDNLRAIHALNEDFAVAVGDNGAIMMTENKTTWTGLTRFVAIGVHLNAIWLQSKTVWWTGTSSGRLYYTLDGGTTWTEKSFPGSAAGVVYDIAFSNDAVGYVSHATAVPRARILRTHSGGGGTGDGGGFYIQPESGHGSMPLADRFNAIAACSYDPNFVVGVGLADDNTDGIIVLGED